MGITHRYRPMLRLLSEDDLGAVRNNRKLLRKVRSERVAIFRGYVKCISRDYARLLAGIGLSAVQSATDRPDLAWAVFRNRMWFAGALCRLDAMVFFYRFGMCGVDVSGLVEAMDALRAFTNATVRVASPAPLAA
jgi:hypothetical protein